jgi:predicted Fe-Mo cluster-binding NifX family protein
MEVVFPVQEDRGLDSGLYAHFGSARFFLVVETTSDSLETLVNQDTEHLHGQCQPLKALGGRSVDAVVAGGIGGGALHKLRAAGITVYRAVEGTVRENLVLVKSGILPEFPVEQVCPAHGSDGECSHS